MARPPLYDTSLFGDGKLTRFRLNIPHAFYIDVKTRQVSLIDGYGPVNPIFSSGLTINSGFTYTNGTEQPGYTLFTDGTGYAYWDLGPTQGVTGITATDGLSSQTTSNVTTIINIDKGSSQNIFKNILVDNTIQFSANSNSDSLNFSGINLTITSAGTNTLVFSAGTGGGGGSGTTDFSAVSINSVTQFTSSSDKTINFSGINISITSASTNTLVFSAGTGGSSVSGAYLPLSGGTVTGATIFQSGLTANTIYTDYIDFNTSSTPVNNEGRLIWNNADEIGGLEVTMMSGNTILQIGEENLARVYNADSVTLTAGTVVYVFGSQGNTISVKRAVNTGETTSSRVLGVVSESIIAGERGFVNTFGLVKGLNTLAYTGGTPIWLGSTPGSWTSTEPDAPNHTVLIGFVSRSASSPNGSLFVHVSNGWELNELHNVYAPSPSDGNVLKYSAATSVWVNSNTINLNGVSASTISATTYQNLPSFNFVQITGTTQFSAGTNNYLNFSGINLTITSAATNTLVFSAGTGGGGGTTVTGGTYSAGTLTLSNSTGGTVSVTGFPATTSFGVTVDGSGGVITTGQKGYIRIPYGFTITSWTLIGSPSGSITFDIWRTNGAIPTVANTIIGGGGTKPSLSTSTYATSSTLTNWTITGATGDVIGWNVDSCTTTTIATLQLFVTRTQ